MSYILYFLFRVYMFLYYDFSGWYSYDNMIEIYLNILKFVYEFYFNVLCVKFWFFVYKNKKLIDFLMFYDDMFSF